MLARSAALFVALSPAVASAADTWTDPHPGIRHLQRDTASQRIDALLVDLSRPELRVRATRSDDRGATVSGFAEDYGLAVAINGDFWQWDGYTTSGLAVGDGAQWPGENDIASEGFIAFGVDNVAAISVPSELLAAPEPWMHDVVGGRPLVVEDGVALDPPDCAPHFCALNPRTAVGLADDGRTLILAVIDGRSGVAAGMTTREVGELMAELGAEIALNFDGGGSTAMYIDVEGGIVNVPSDGSERVVANQLGVEIVEPIGTLHGTVRGRDGEPIAGAQVELSSGALGSTSARGSFELVDVAAGDTIVTATHPQWEEGEVALWIAAQDTTQTELVLDPRPPPAADSGEASSGVAGSDETDAAPGESSTTAGDVPGSELPGPMPGAETTSGCGCNAAPGGTAVLFGLLVLLAARRRRAAVLVLMAASCVDPQDVPDEPPSATSIRFAPGEGEPLPFAAVPFPSELYRDEAGSIAIGALPNPKTDTPLFASIRGQLAQRSGFCASCNITFGVDGELDPAMLPADAEPGDVASPDDPIVLVDVDPESPALGEAIPLRLQYDAAAGLLAIRPARGHVLHGGRRYAAVVTDRVRGSDDLPLAAPPAFAAMRDDEDPRLAPTFDALAELGLARAHVVGLAAFTTEDPSADLRALRMAIHAAAPPTFTVDAVWADAALDDLLGVPASPGPGVDRPPAPGTDGTAAIAHDTVALVVAGSFAAPRFAAGTGTDVGALTRDEGGTPIVGELDRVPFVLIIPKDVPLDRLPVVISHHGFNASRTTGFVLADTVGAEGFATLAIDAYQHGDRAASAVDRVHAMRGGCDGADGFAETVQLDVSSRVFGLGGVPSDRVLDPAYPLAAFAQFAADVMSTVRLVREGDLAELRAADPRLAMLAFDNDRIVFVGNSMGAVVGTAVAVTEPDVHAFVLDVMPGSIVETLAESAEFRPLMETLLLPLLGVDAEFDEVDRAVLFDPTVDLVRWVLEPVDPLALAPGLVREGGPDLLVQLAGHDEVAAPTASESVLAAAGVPGQGTFGFAAVEPTQAPLTANLGGATIAAMRFDGAMHGMLEVSRQSSHWAEPLEPPLVERSSVALDNPTAAVHHQIAAFSGSFLRDGRATIVP
jgi:Phosphodiester glycosidase